MKLLLLMCLPMQTLCCAGSQRKEPSFHSELNTAIYDLTIAPSTANKQTILAGINISLLAGSELKCTNYTLHDITNVIPGDELEQLARKNEWNGILKLLGLWQVFAVKK